MTRKIAARPMIPRSPVPNLSAPLRAQAAYELRVVVSAREIALAGRTLLQYGALAVKELIR